MNTNLEVLYLDTETYSNRDLKKVGAFKYHEDSELMLCGFLLGDNYYSWEAGEDIPEWVLDHIGNGGIVKAFNMMFDWLALRGTLALPLMQCRDIAAKTAAHALPTSLDKCCKALRLDDSTAKYTDGKRLVLKFCKPRNVAESNPVKRFTKETSPEEWNEFKHKYLPLDCYSIREIDRLLPDNSLFEEQIWRDTCLINMEGVPIDVPLVETVSEQIDHYIDEETTKCIRISGIWPTQRDKLLAWCAEQGTTLPNLQKETVAAYIEAPNTSEIVREVLQARANTANVSLKKYDSLKRTVCEDGTVKGTLYYHAANTGRWGGRLFQVHNLPRGSMDARDAIELLKARDFSTEAAVSAIRGLISHANGVTIYDWAQIEARVVQWLAGDMEALGMFTVPGRDPYTIFASETVYNKPYEEIDKDERFMAKQAVLGLGFEMWFHKFRMMLESYGIEDIPLDEELKRIVVAYRNKHQKLVSFWKLMNKGALIALERPGQEIVVNRHIRFQKLGNFLYMTLPSGRKLAYCDPEIRENRFGSPGVTYMGVNDQSQWVRLETYGGKLTENATQAVARDVLAEATTTAIQHGIRILFHLHDEVVFLGGYDNNLLEKILTRRPEWASELPLEVDGANSPCYRKI